MLITEGPSYSFERREKQIRRKAGPSISSLTPQAQLSPVLLRKDLTEHRVQLGSRTIRSAEKATQRDLQDGEKMAVRAVGVVGTHESRLILHIHIPPSKTQLQRAPQGCMLVSHVHPSSAEMHTHLWSFSTTFKGRKGLPGLLS